MAMWIVMQMNGRMMMAMHKLMMAMVLAKVVMAKGRCETPRQRKPSPHKPSWMVGPVKVGHGLGGCLGNGFAWEWLGLGWVGLGFDWGWVWVGCP